MIHGFQRSTRYIIRSRSRRRSFRATRYDHAKNRATLSPEIFSRLLNHGKFNSDQQRFDAIYNYVRLH